MSKRLTLEEFVEKARKVHGDKYNYDKVEYIDGRTPVEIGCSKHGYFKQMPHDHLVGHGCPDCAKEREAEKKRDTTETFIKKAKAIHGDKYNYDRVEYIDTYTDVEIGCSKHGYFKQRPNSHLNGRGCPICGIEERANKKRDTTETFIKKARKVHGDKYNYDKVEYINSTTEVEIGCSEHGYFKQTPANHLQGHGCPDCKKDKTVQRSKYTTETFIKKAREIHGDKYDYDKVEYKDYYTEVEIYCKECKKYFSQKPYLHLEGHGCPDCGGSKQLTTEIFIEKAKAVHGDKYNYDKVEYINAHTPVLIGCSKHGYFKQKPNDHLSGYGCPHCNTSKGCQRVANYLKQHNINFIYDKACIDWLAPQRPDFYLPDYNIIIEYDGEQHFHPVKWNYKMTDEEALNTFEVVKRNDSHKNLLCEEHNIRLIRIPYIDFDNIESILEAELKTA